MKSINFIILAVVCGVLAVAAFVVLNTGKGVKPDTMEGKELLEGVPINDAAAIAITGPEQSVQLVKGETVWEVKDRYGYPADFGDITEFAKKLTEMKVGRSFPADDDTRKRLSLTKPDAENTDNGTKGDRVVIKNGADETLVDLIIGSAREASAGSGGHYVMKADGDTIFLVDEEFTTLDKEPAEWIDTELLDVAAADVREVVCVNTQDGAVAYRLQRPKKGEEPVFVDLPEGTTAKADAIRNTFSALASFNIEDVADPNAPDETTGFGDGHCFEFHLFDGTIYTICPGDAVGEEENQNYLKVSASYKTPDPVAEETDEAAGESDSENAAADDAVTDEAATEGDAETTEESAAVETEETEAESGDDAASEAEKLDTAKLAADAEAFNERVNKWIYVAPKWKVDRLLTDPDGLYEPAKAEEEATDTATPPAPPTGGDG